MDDSFCWDPSASRSMRYQAKMVEHAKKKRQDEKAKERQSPSKVYFEWPQETKSAVQGAQFVVLCSIFFGPVRPCCRALQISTNTKIEQNRTEWSAMYEIISISISYQIRSDHFISYHIT